MSGWRVVEVPAPDDDVAGVAGLADHWTVQGTARVSRAVELATHGHDDLALDAAVAAASLAHQEYERCLRTVVVPDDLPGPPTADDVVGRGFLLLPDAGNTHLASAYVAVVPDARGRGAGTALWEDLLARVRAEGRTVVIGDNAYTPEPPAGPGALEPPTGHGRVPRDDPGTRFALARGFALEQVVRHSVLDLPVDAGLLGRLALEAHDVAGDAYRVHTWHGACPDAWVDHLADLESRMSTDAPSAGLDIEEDPWDAARVRVVEAEYADRGERLLTTVAEHVATGALVAFSQLSLPAARPAVVYQQDTLVHGDHRGHRLGMLVKTAALAELATAHPGARRVHTWNAQENDHMLAINVALGFRPDGGDAEWQLRLA